MSAAKKRILLVEDEPHLAFSLDFNLRSEGFDVVVATTGVEALEHWQKQGPFALIILDVMLPEINGFQVAQTIRKTDKATGILMLTARATEEDILQGLQLGADDYMTKPFHLQEFILRVKRMAERSDYINPNNGAAKASLRFRDFELFFDELRLVTPQGPVDITDLEAKLLAEFFANPGKTLTRNYLLEKVWGLNSEVETRTVDNFIMRLRKYLETDASQPKHLESIRGKGYRLNL